MELCLLRILAKWKDGLIRAVGLHGSVHLLLCRRDQACSGWYGHRLQTHLHLLKRVSVMVRRGMDLAQICSTTHQPGVHRRQGAQSEHHSLPYLALFFDKLCIKPQLTPPRKATSQSLPVQGIFGTYYIASSSYITTSGNPLSPYPWCDCNPQGRD